MTRNQAELIVEAGNRLGLAIELYYADVDWLSSGTPGVLGKLPDIIQAIAVATAHIESANDRAAFTASMRVQIEPCGGVRHMVY